MAAVVTAHLWQVSRRDVPWALSAVARHRRRVRALPGVRFAKLMGTSTGFSARDADLTRWLLVTAWNDAATAHGFARCGPARTWARHSVESWSAVLRPIAARGRWSGREPFLADPDLRDWDGPVAALTRARLAPRRAVTFWRAVPPVAHVAAGTPGLRLSLGVGEAPLGVQGTFTVWSDRQALRAFAYGTPEHRDAIAATRRIGWYSEDLFSRFAVLSSAGTVDGRDPLDGRR